MATDDHIRRNRDRWNATAGEWIAAAERNWAAEEPRWGEWGVAESELQMLPEDMTGMDAVDLGCGTGYVSSWMARRGARVRAIDLSAEQLATARRLQALHGTAIDFVEGDAERLPWEDESADFAISEYGAVTWCEPEAWLREAHRVLRPGGRLVFLGAHPLLDICWPLDGSVPAVETFQQSYFDLSRQDWSEEGVDFNLPLETWFALFRDIGFEVEDYREPRASANGPNWGDMITRDWAHRFPSEQVFTLRKR